MASSGTYGWNPALAEFVLEAFSRIQIYAPAIEDHHIIEARRSMNFVLQDISGNRGLNLWAVGDETLNVPLIPGMPFYQLPANTVSLLDTYLRQYTPGAQSLLGYTLTAMTLAGGMPMLTAAGEPMVLAPGSGVFSTVEGSQEITMDWPAHGLAPGLPIFFGTPVTAGAMTISGFVIVATVIDTNTVTFLAPRPAPATRHAVGGTPLFVAAQGSSAITIVLAGHGLSAGQFFPVQFPVTIGGLVVMPGLYVVQEVLSAYSFAITALPSAPLASSLFVLGQSVAGGREVLGVETGDLPIAASSEAAFEAGGQIVVATQSPNVQMTDLLLWPISRNDYAALPNKLALGRPSIFWFDRTITPSVRIWPAGDPAAAYGMVAYRLRELQDASPAGGQTLDMPRRFFPSFAAELTAALAEKFKPDAFVAKAQIAAALWDRAANADTERVSTYIVPAMDAYYR